MKFHVQITKYVRVENWGNWKRLWLSTIVVTLIDWPIEGKCKWGVRESYCSSIDSENFRLEHWAAHAREYQCDLILTQQVVKYSNATTDFSLR